MSRDPAAQLPPGSYWRARAMRGLKTDRTARVVIAGHAFMQNVRRGHYELGVEAHPHLRTAAAFDELTDVI